MGWPSYFEDNVEAITSRFSQPIVQRTSTGIGPAGRQSRKSNRGQSKGSQPQEATALHITHASIASITATHDKTAYRATKATLLAGHYHRLRIAYEVIAPKIRDKHQKENWSGLGSDMERLESMVSQFNYSTLFDGQREVKAKAESLEAELDAVIHRARSCAVSSPIL